MGRGAVVFDNCRGKARTPHCSFCGKTQAEIKKLIARKLARWRRIPVSVLDADSLDDGG